MKRFFSFFLLIGSVLFADMDPLLQARHSGYDFDPNRALDPAVMKELATAARWAPSCYNDQPWDYLFCHREKHPEAFEKVVEALVPFNQEWVANVPLLIVACANTTFRKNGKPNRWGAYDAGAASMAICLQAVSMGLMVHQMGGFDEQKISDSFSIPDHVHPMAVMAVGYEKQNPSDRERTRIELTDNFFAGSWETPL